MDRREIGSEGCELDWSGLG